MLGIKLSLLDSTSVNPHQCECPAERNMPLLNLLNFHLTSASHNVQRCSCPLPLICVYFNYFSFIITFSFVFANLSPIGQIKCLI